MDAAALSCFLNPALGSGDGIGTGHPCQDKTGMATGSNALKAVWSRAVLDVETCK
jgi:hypothetical protein